MAENLVSDLQPFHAMEVLSRAKRLEAEGHDICHLELGEPATPPAPKVLDAVRAALSDPQGYTHAKGQIELREALKNYYREQHGVTVDAENLLVTMGSSAGFILAFLAAFDKGARIAVTRPGYPAYLNILAGLGFEPVEIPLTAKNGWKLTSGALAEMHAKTPFDGLLFASPANPTGASVNRKELGQLVSTCAELGVRLISDEIYHGLDHTGPSVSAGELTDQAIIINSFSKYYCMTGYRIGWMVMPGDLVRRTEILQQNLFISAPTLSQVAARVALGEREYAEARKADYAANRLLIGKDLTALGFEGKPGDGGFYAYMDVSKFTNDSLGFCHTLLNEAHVAATPGIDFDRVNGHRFVRFSCAGSRETMERALDRIGAFVHRM